MTHNPGSEKDAQAQRITVTVKELNVSNGEVAQPESAFRASKQPELNPATHVEKLGTVEFTRDHSKGAESVELGGSMGLTGQSAECAWRVPGQ